MGSFIALINGFTAGINGFVELVKAYPWQVLAIVAIVAVAVMHKRFKTARDFVRNMDGGYIVIDGNF